MGNQVQFCNKCQPLDKHETTLKFKESACVQIVDNLPRVKGKFNFEKQASFNKIQKAASDYCQKNYIQKSHMMLIARLLAYQQTHYFQVIRQLPVPLRQRFVQNQQNIDIQLMDSLYHYFVVKQNKKANPSLFLKIGQISPAPCINIDQINYDHREDLVLQGLHMIRTGKVALVIMAAGIAQHDKNTSKALARLNIPGYPTVIELLVERYLKYLRTGNHQSTMDHTINTSKKRKEVITPIIIICCEQNYIAIREIFHRNQNFGLQEHYIKILIEDRTVPLIDRYGKLCISFEEKTLAYPGGTALAVPMILKPKIKSFLECCYSEYVHIIGCQNIAQMPCDPLLLGLTYKLDRKVAGKCVNSTSLYQKYPRYVSTKPAFHLLDMNELNSLGDVNMMIQSPLALNSMVFKLDSLYEYYSNFDTNLYIAKRFHMYEVRANYYDFQHKKPIVNQRVFNFEQDIRDYISASNQTIVVKYRKEHFKPILSVEHIPQLSQEFQQPQLY